MSLSDESQIHSLDRAVQLTPTGEGEYLGATTDLYWNVIGPFGGATAATLLQAVLRHPKRLGAPVSLTVNFAGPVAKGAFTVRARAVRTNRSTQHWYVEQLQANAQGQFEVQTTATVVTGARRGDFNVVENTLPQAPAPEDVPLTQIPRGPNWFACYELRAVKGAPPRQWNGSDAGDSLNQMWLRDAPSRPLDYLSLTATADFFYPRIWRRRATQVPVGTVTMTTYFHADEAALTAAGDDYLFAQARGQAFFKGFFDHSAQLWSRQGALLATSHQIFYFKE